jgi:serine protease AprX
LVLGGRPGEDPVHANCPAPAKAPHPVARPAQGLLRTTAKNLKQADALGRGQGLLDIKKASGASIPAVTTQPYPTAVGLGSLEAARGTTHILDGDLELVGDPWDGRRWSENSWTGTSWNGGAWNGHAWSGELYN